MKTLASRLCIVLLSVVLTSCMVLTMPKGPTPDSRANISAEVPVFIINGSTSRTEILLRLGEPDGAAEDDRRFIYTKRVRTAGQEIRFCGYGGCDWWSSSEMAYDRLTIQFDDKNVVTSTRHERISCTEKYDDSHHENPCVDTVNLDLKLKTNDIVLPRVIWCPGVRLDRSEFSDLYFRNKRGCPGGALSIGATALDLYPSNANNKTAPILSFPYAEIATIETMGNWLINYQGFFIKKKDGTYDSVRVYADQDKTKELPELLLSRVKAAAK